MIQRSMNFFQDIEIREVLIRVADLLQLPINVVHEVFFISFFTRCFQRVTRGGANANFPLLILIVK